MDVHCPERCAEYTQRYMATKELQSDVQDKQRTGPYSWSDVQLDTDPQVQHLTDWSALKYLCLIQPLTHEKAVIQ